MNRTLPKTRLTDKGKGQFRWPTQGIALAAMIGIFACAALAGAAPRSRAGTALFRSNCSACHGVDGKGNTPFGRSAKIPDLRSAEVQKKTDAVLAHFIANGKGSMPPFKNTLSKAQIHSLVEAIRALAPKK